MKRIVRISMQTNKTIEICKKILIISCIVFLICLSIYKKACIAAINASSLDDNDFDYYRISIKVNNYLHDNFEIKELGE